MTQPIPVGITSAVIDGESKFLFVTQILYSDGSVQTRKDFEPDWVETRPPDPIDEETDYEVGNCRDCGQTVMESHEYTYGGTADKMTYVRHSAVEDCKK